jgi:hypothetical protein
MTVAADKSALGEFLRSRRQTLQPEDLGLYRGPRRRVGGLPGAWPGPVAV